MVYAPGTLEKDPQKQNMALQQHAGQLETANSSISALQTKTSGYEAAWTAYTPTVTAQTGTLTTVSATGASLTIGKTVLLVINITITTNGTGSGWIKATLPATSASGVNVVLSGREDATTGKMLQARITSGSTFAEIFNYDGSYAGGNGNVLYVSGIYQKS